MKIHNRIQRLAHRFIADRRYKYYDMFTKNLSLTKDQLTGLQNRYIQQIIEYAYNHTTYYKKLLDSAQIRPSEIRCKEDLKKIPLLTKSIIKENIDLIKSDDRHSKNLIEITSSGSTGDQALIYRSRYCDAVAKGITLRTMQLAGWNPWDSAVTAWSSLRDYRKVQNSLILRISLIVNKILYINAYRYTQTDFYVWVRKIKRSKPKVFFGSAMPTLDFANFLIEKDLNLPSIKTVITGAETLKERDTIEKAFGCQVHNHYGCNELDSIAVETDKNNLRIADDYIALNIHKNNEIVITSLHSYGFPLINYKLGDYGIVRDNDFKPDKIPLSSLDLKIGRLIEDFLAKDGSTVNSSAIASDIANRKLPIKKYQLIQNDFDDFLVNLIPEQGFSENHKTDFKKSLEEYFGQKVNIIFNHVEQIPKERSGKQLMFKRTFRQT